MESERARARAREREREREAVEQSTALQSKCRAERDVNFTVLTPLKLDFISVIKPL